jgi:hypothetical protein
MARNDIVLLDSLVDKARAQLGESRDRSEIFELFCLNQLLKDFELSFEELETGWTDGEDDGGIDGFYVLVDGVLVTDSDISHISHRNPEIRVEIFTINRADSFQQKPLNSLLTSLTEVLDLTKSDSEMSYPFCDEVLSQREIFNKIFVSLADRRPKLVVSIYYCCRGETQTLATNLTSRATQLEKLVKSLFSHVETTFKFLGAAELIELARRQRAYSLRLPFIESYISRGGDNYVVLVNLPSYYRFITDDDGALRRYLFESNVRDYLGEGNINRDIRETLERKVHASDEDFWWLNNGITILATHAMVVGKELSLENLQIVNGLQTTETIYHYFSDNEEIEDNRAILVFVVSIRFKEISSTFLLTTDGTMIVVRTSIRIKVDHQIVLFQFHI